MSTIATTPDVRVIDGTWNADPSHSTVEFAVKHMGFSTVRGRFLDFDATLKGGDEPALSGAIRVASVSTHDEARDNHIKAPDFFDAERYPEATVVTTSIGEDRLVADVTLKGVTRPVEFSYRLSEPATDPWGNERVGLDLEAQIDRTEFGVNWNAPLPGGGFLVDNTVSLIASFSLVKA
jgi:polyisoprenoid-binding protein YceI